MDSYLFMVLQNLLLAIKETVLHLVNSNLISSLSPEYESKIESYKHCIEELDRKSINLVTFRKPM